MTKTKKFMNEWIDEWMHVIKSFEDFEETNQDEIKQIIIVGKSGSIRRLLLKKRQEKELDLRYVG